MSAAPRSSGHRIRLARVAAWGLAALLLVAPFLAMQVTTDVQWTGSDFAVFSGLLLLIGGGCEWAFRRVGSWEGRAGWALTLLTAALLVLVNGAVGLIGSERADANGLFGIVLAVLAVGLVITKARLGRLAPVLAATGITQVAVAALILLGSFISPDAWNLRDALFAGPGFAGLWFLAAVLFRRAAQYANRMA